MYGRDLARVTALLLALCPVVVSARAARPDPLRGQAGCERYQGTPHEANDPSQLLELRLCAGANGAVLATLQTSSLVSGWSARASTGTWQGDALTLRETEFLQYQPENGWRFCLIDEMKLQRTPEGALRGTYVSQACQDHASFVLERVAEAGGQGTTTAVPKPTSPRSPAPEQPEIPLSQLRMPERATEPDSKPGCGCTSTSEPWPGLAGLLLLACGLRRRSARQPARVKPDRNV